MAFISSKVIRGIKRHYLEKSIRLPNGKVKKFSAYLKGYSPGKKYWGFEYYKALLDSKIRKELVEFAPSYYKKSAIFDEKMLKSSEEIKLDYKDILKKSPKSNGRT